MRDHEPTDRLPRVRVAGVGDGNLDEAPEIEVVGIPAGSFADCARGMDRMLEPREIGTDGEADAVRPPCCGLDRLRAGGGDIDARPLDPERRVDVVEPRHRHRRTFEIDALPAEETLEPLQVLLELGDAHRLLAENLDGTVASPEAEAGPAVRDPLQRRHRTGRKERVAQRHRHRGTELQRVRRSCGNGERRVRIGQQTVRLAHCETVPPVVLELAGEPSDLRDRNRGRTHPPELCRRGKSGHRARTVHALTPGAP